MLKRNICFIRAKLKKDYVFDGIRDSGYRIIIPYKDLTLIHRILRECWFRMKLPGRRVWYNREIKTINEDIIILYDPLITEDLVHYIRKLHPEAKIIFSYENRVSKVLNPDNIREDVDEIWSYDGNDCHDYRLRLQPSAYLDCYQIEKADSLKYDVLYVGRDKGRLQQIEAIENAFREQGLRTHFHICADRAFLVWKKKRYRPFLPYDEYLEYLKVSKAILNIVPKGQKSITQREMEAAFDGIKCITNNQGIVDFPLYDPSRYHLLQEDTISEVKSFLERPFRPIDEKQLDNYRFNAVIDRMLQEEES